MKRQVHTAYRTLPASNVHGRLTRLHCRQGTSAQRNIGFRRILAAVQPGTLQTSDHQTGRTTVAEPAAAEGAAMYSPPAVRQSAAFATSAQDADDQQFDWYKAWYPLAVLSDLDPDLPSHAAVLGIDLAVWYDVHAKKWRVFQDRCPHRLAPLSEGRIDDKTGHLYCNYHGWQFDGSGSCTDIPQLAQGQSFSSDRACAISYPTCEREGLLWVWPDSSPTAAAESSCPEVWPGLAPELEEVGSKGPAPGGRGWYFRDLPACWLAAKENAFNDCSHDSVLHHNTNVYLNRSQAAPIDMRLAEMTPTGYTVCEASGRFQDTARFPCGSAREGFFGKGIAYVVPTGIGSCRQFSAVVPPQQKQPQKPPQQQQSESSGNSSNSSSSSRSSNSAHNMRGQPIGQPNPLVATVDKFVRRLKPTWAHHMMSHSLVDADIAIQSKIDIQRAVSDKVYMPAAVDAGPAAFMQWLKKYGNNGPAVAKLNDPFLGLQHSVPADRRQLLDRYHSHTANCKACRTAYEQFKVARRVIAVVALLTGGAAVAVAALMLAGAVPLVVSAAGQSQMSARQAGLQALSGLGVIASLAGIVWAAIGRVLQSFEFIDYGKHHVSKQ